jgi:hypothetical protein
MPVLTSAMPLLIIAVAVILLFLFWDNIFGGDVTLVESGPASSKQRRRGRGGGDAE